MVRNFAFVLPEADNSMIRIFFSWTSILPPEKDADAEKHIPLGLGNRGPKPRCGWLVRRSLLIALDENDKYSLFWIFSKILRSQNIGAFALRQHDAIRTIFGKKQ